MAGGWGVEGEGVSGGGGVGGWAARKWRPVDETIKGDFYIISPGRSQHTKVRNWELQAYYYGDKYFTLDFKIFRM